MSKCSTTNFNVDASPNLLPRPEKSSVRADMNKAMRSMTQKNLRKESGAVITPAEKAVATKVKPASKGAKRFDAAVQHPVLKNLGL